MKFLTRLVLVSFFMFIQGHLFSLEKINVIPKPNKIEIKGGTFILTNNISITYNNKKLKNEAEFLKDLLSIKDNKVLIKFSCNTSINSNIILSLNKKYQKNLGKEGYLLDIRDKNISISANHTSGVFYGIQTLRQLLPVEIEKKSFPQKTLTLPQLKIQDTPKYSWRGQLLDESRHFFGKKTVKQLLNIMAFYKLNRFHWHLTDSDGWRIEIKKYPKLTSVGGIGFKGNKTAPAQFYTQKEIKEIVEYAKKRHIIVIPEIDMPGHATAANRAYPEFSGGPDKTKAYFTFNPGKEATYKYLNNILKEVVRLFPGPWIHYGGDEAHFGSKSWKHLDDVKKLMKQKNLKSLSDVEHYFNRRMANNISKLGKTTVGWDEIVNSGVKPNQAIIMWWRHEKPQQRDLAIKKGFKVVLCPRKPCYFDFVQHKTHRNGRRWKGFCSLDKVYKGPPVSDKYTKKQKAQIMGIQANLWSERFTNGNWVTYMIVPRISALSEAAWTKDKDKSYDDYLNNLKSHIKRYDAWNIVYFNPFDPKSTPEPKK